MQGRTLHALHACLCVHAHIEGCADVGVEVQTHACGGWGFMLGSILNLPPSFSPRLGISLNLEQSDLARLTA